jgi:hypothetical protein
MPAKPQALPDEDVLTNRRLAERQADAVCLSVMRVLGRPQDLFRISAMPLWSNHYRVNVQTGPDAVSVRIAHSFFVEVDESGSIIESIPTLERRY